MNEQIHFENRPHSILNFYLQNVAIIQDKYSPTQPHNGEPEREISIF